MVKLKQQRGVALLTVILIVTLITIASVSMRAHQELDIRRTVNELNSAQALMYLRGAEYLSKSVLKEDAKKKDNYDSLDEDWATVLPPFPVDGGSLRGVLEDLTARFNINNLVNLDGKINNLAYQRFKRLLSNNSINVEIADAVVDWIDKDENARPAGAEDGFYLGKEKFAHRTPNRLIVSTTELLQVKGVNIKIFNTIKEFITALPVRTDINVNTAGKEVLKMLGNLSDGDVDEIIKNRKKKPFKNRNDFRTIAAVNSALNSGNTAGNSSGNTTNSTADVGWDVKSNYFLLTSTAVIGDLELKMQSILKRENKKSVTVIVRSQGGL